MAGADHREERNARAPACRRNRQLRPRTHGQARRCEVIALSQIRKPDTSFPAFFRYRAVKDRYVLTNYEGSYIVLSDEQFRGYLEGTIQKDSALYGDLKARNFIRAEFDANKAA